MPSAQMRDPARQLSLWPDATFEGAYTRHYRRRIQNPYSGSLQWRCRRSEVIVRQRFRCYRCQREMRLQVHHLSYANLGDEHPADLVALCLTCHWTVHHDEQEANRLFRPCGVL
jgi:hypothetical protein